MKPSSLVSNRLPRSDAPKYGTDALGVSIGGVTPPPLLGVPPPLENLLPSIPPPGVIGGVVPPFVCIMRQGVLVPGRDVTGVRAPVRVGVRAPGIVSIGGPGIEGGGPSGGWLGIMGIEGA